METIKIFLFQFFIFFVFSCSNHSTEYTLEIDSKWEFQSEKGEPFMPASVPGTVHLDLLQNGKIDDPFFRLNEHQLQWIDKLDWEYRTSFDVNDFHFDYEVIAVSYTHLTLPTTPYV